MKYYTWVGVVNTILRNNRCNVTPDLDRKHLLSPKMGVNSPAFTPSLPYTMTSEAVTMFRIRGMFGLSNAAPKGKCNSWHEKGFQYMAIKFGFYPVGGKEDADKKENNKTTLERSMAVADSLKHPPAILPSHFTSRCLLKRNKNVCSPKHLLQMFLVALFVTQTGNSHMSMYWWMEKQTTVHPGNGILLNNKK